jgi:anthranilate synthase component 2
LLRGNQTTDVSQPPANGTPAMLLLLDNYDSFTYNLYHYLGELGAEVVVWRNDALSADDALALRPDGIVISPGPCDPDRAGISLNLVRAAAGVCPLLGVCLGHQAIAQAFGGRIVRAPAIMHGKLSPIEHAGEGLFEGLPAPFMATRYHSLVAEPASLPSCLRVTARTEDGTIMGLAHETLPVYGVQFHPESIATEHGHRLLRNFLATVPAKVAA